MSQIYFWNKTLPVSGSSSVHHQEFFTVHTAVVYVIQVGCQQTCMTVLALIYVPVFKIRLSYTVMSCVWHCICDQSVSKLVWHVPLLCVQWKTPDDGQRNCPKHVGFYSKNKFEKLVHLVGFIIRIFQDARSPERQKSLPPTAQLGSKMLMR